MKRKKNIKAFRGALEDELDFYVIHFWYYSCVGQFTIQLFGIILFPFSFIKVKVTAHHGRVVSIMAVCHVTATMATNTSFSMVSASSTKAIKLMEPILTSIIQSIVLGTQIKVTFRNILETFY